jgi:hypothetical protein
MWILKKKYDYWWKKYGLEKTERATKTSHFDRNWAISLKPRRRSRPLRLVWWALGFHISGTCLIWHTKGPRKCVGLYRMSKYSGFILVKYFETINFCQMSRYVGKLRCRIAQVQLYNLTIPPQSRRHFPTRHMGTLWGSSVVGWAYRTMTHTQPTCHGYNFVISSLITLCSCSGVVTIPSLKNSP